jgi:manganese transport protein
MAKNREESHIHLKSLGEVHSSVNTQQPNIFRRIFAFAGPAYLISVGYMDPGNWATDLEGGSRFGYSLIWVILLSNIVALILQTLSARLGIVTGKDLAQACRSEYSKATSFLLWILAEVAIAACDLAEVLGTILGLNLLFKLPLLWGAVIALFDTFLLLAIQRLGIRKMELFIVSMITVIALGFIVNLFLAKPEWKSVASGFIPSLPEGSLYIVLGIIGATVMPHNLYLHSALVQTRKVSRIVDSKAEAIRYNLLDSAVALNIAFFVNAAILVLSASVFYKNGIVVTEIQQANKLLEQLLGSNFASLAFGLALLCSGQSSTITGTLAGQIVMEGFIHIRLNPVIRRLLTRSIALLPAVIVIAIAGDKGTYKLLILSQVILSLQLPFAIIPLVHFTGNKIKMGKFVSNLPLKLSAWVVSIVIIILNAKLLFDQSVSMLDAHPSYLLSALILVLSLLIGFFLLYLLMFPIFNKSKGWRGEHIEGAASVIEKIETTPIKNIVVALGRDGSDAQVIGKALSLAKMSDSLITLLHVADSAAGSVYGSEIYDEHTRKDEEYLVEIAEQIRNYGVPVEIALAFGNPASEIIKFVTSHKTDLLVMGAHGHSLLSDILLGETVEPVRHKLNIPILVVR